VVVILLHPVEKNFLRYKKKSVFEEKLIKKNTSLSVIISVYSLFDSAEIHKCHFTGTQFLLLHVQTKRSTVMH